MPKFTKPKDLNPASMLNQNKAESIKMLLETIAYFVDKHDIVVPELTVRFGACEVTLTAKKIENKD